MAKLTPAQEYGATLGAMKRGFEEMFRQIAQGFQLGYSPPESLTEEQRELLREQKSEARYQRRIQHERDLGQAFVRNKARQVRRELGLNPTDLA